MSKQLLRQWDAALLQAGEVIATILDESGPMTRKELAERLNSTEDLVYGVMIATPHLTHVDEVRGKIIIFTKQQWLDRQR